MLRCSHNWYVFCLCLDRVKIFLSCVVYIQLLEDCINLMTLHTLLLLTRECLDLLSLIDSLLQSVGLVRDLIECLVLKLRQHELLILIKEVAGHIKIELHLFEFVLGQCGIEDV